MKRFIIAGLVVVFFAVIGWADAIVDNFNTIDTSFWNLDTNLVQLTADPDASGSHGSVLRLIGVSGAVSHTFDSALYGTMSLDIYDNSTPPDQYVVFKGVNGSDQARISLEGTVTGGLPYVPFINGNMVVSDSLVPRSVGWHTLSLVYGIDSTCAYVDGVLEASSDKGSGCSTVFFEGVDAAGSYYDNFTYTPAVVPEPPTVIMMLIGGLIVLAWAGKSKLMMK